MRIFCTLFLLFTFCLAKAQHAVLRRNVVYVNDEAVFKIASVGTLAHQAYKIKNMQDEDLMLLDQTPLRNNQGTPLLKFVFYQLPEAEAYIPVNVNFKKPLVRILCNYNVITNGKLNPEGVNLFCKNYGLGNYPSKYIAAENTVVTEPVKEVTQTVTEPVPERVKEIVPVENPKVEEPVNEIVIENSTEIDTTAYVEAPVEMTKADPGNEFDYPMVLRDISQQIYLSGNKIRQDFKEIGAYSAQQTTLLGKPGTEITVQAVNGQKVATARFINGEEQSEVMVMKDNRILNIQIPGGDIYSIVKEIIKVLADKMYL